MRFCSCKQYALSAKSLYIYIYTLQKRDRKKGIYLGKRTSTNITKISLSFKSAVAWFCLINETYFKNT